MSEDNHAKVVRAAEENQLALWVIPTTDIKKSTIR